MAEDIAMVLVILAALHGAADLIFRMAFRVLFGKCEHLYLTMLLSGDKDDAEFHIRRLAAIRRFFPSGHVKAITIDRGVDEEQKAIAQKLCNELRVDMYNEKEWWQMLTDGLQIQENTV